MRHKSELVEVNYSGESGASSAWKAEYNAAQAFKPESGGLWISHGLPATIWYHFNYNFSLAKISFTSRTNNRNSGDWAQAPKTFNVVGSHDCSNWHVLKSVTNANFDAPGQTKMWNIPCENQKSYECYGIQAVGWRNCVSLTNIQMMMGKINVLKNGV